MFIKKYVRILLYGYGIRNIRKSTKCFVANKFFVSLYFVTLSKT